MAEAIAFDTHRFVKNLTEHGFSLKQAEVLAAEQVNLLNSNLATKADVAGMATKTDIEKLRLATKSDVAEIYASIDRLRLETQASIEKLRLETQSGIEKLKAELVKWMFGALIAQGGLVVALIRFA